jgi:hypothetical protein
MKTFSEIDFDSLSFHDNLFLGLLFRNDEKERCDLVLDIDHISEWHCIEGSYEFSIASADLTFHGVTGLRFRMGGSDDNYQIASVGDWILDVRREPIVPQLVYLDRPYWRWEFSFAMETELSFGAYGFTLRYRQDPIRRREQHLPLEIRA